MSDKINLKKVLKRRLITMLEAEQIINEQHLKYIKELRDRNEYLEELSKELKSHLAIAWALNRRLRDGKSTEQILYKEFMLAQGCDQEIQDKVNTIIWGTDEEFNELMGAKK